MGFTVSYADYAITDLQRTIAKYMDEGLSSRQIAKHTGQDSANVRRAVAKIKARAASKGFSPKHGLVNPAAPGFGLNAYSDMQRNANGDPIWLKYKADAARQEQMFIEYMQGLCETITPKKPKKTTRKNHTPQLMTGIFIGDAHVGMQAFASETRHSDFNVDIACQQLRDAFDYLIDKAEPTEIGLLTDVGDLIHANGKAASTFKGTPVDTDSTYYGMMRAAGLTLNYAIDKMLTKFKRVIVVVVRGNHNDDPAVGVQLMLEFRYMNEPRVQVLRNEGYINYIEYGKWLLGATHGDKQKPESQVTSMARDMPEAWGRTTHRMICSGHYHKESVKSLPGAKHKVFGALPPPDSWHAGMGFQGDGEMEMLTFRKEGGLYSSHVYNIPQPRFEPDVKI